LKLVECVPNFSTADAAVVDALVESIGPDLVLDRTSDVDHGRSVITFGGEPERVRDAAVRMVGRAAELIDLRVHAGVHPRIGATDVVPFVPLGEATMAECVELAWSAGREINERFRIPVFFYEAAALRPEHRNLADVRKNPVEPDLAGDHPSAGAVVVGARKFLIAYNINLKTADVGVAKAIAKKIRERDGGLKAVKALGLMLESQGCAQVSMNLVDHEVTGVEDVNRAVEREARALGVDVLGHELIGLLPEQVVRRLMVRRLTLKEGVSHN
jgi:glutamate formiminotransferase